MSFRISFPTEHTYVARGVEGRPGQHELLDRSFWILMENQERLSPWSDGSPSTGDLCI